MDDLHAPWSLVADGTPDSPLYDVFDSQNRLVAFALSREHAELVRALPASRAALADLVAAARTVGAVWEQGDLAGAVRELVDLAETTGADYDLDVKETNECQS